MTTTVLRRSLVAPNALRFGLIGGAASIFLAAIGMTEKFAERLLLPNLTLGRVIMFVVPFLVGRVVGKPPPVLEGMEAERPGIRNVVGGFVAGAITGMVLWLLPLVIALVDVRDVLVNFSQATADYVAFDQSLAEALPLLILMGAVLGAAGGSLHVASQRVRRAVMRTVSTVLLFGMFELVVSTIFRQAGEVLSGLPGIGELFSNLPRVVDFLYEPLGGFTGRGASVVALAGLAVAWFLPARTQAAQARFRKLPPDRRRRALLIGAAVLGGVLIFLPQFLGSYLAEVLDIVGIFLLMGLGLNIVVGFAGMLDLGYVAFFAVGAYVSALMTSPNSPRWSPEFGFWQTLPFVIIAAILAGVAVATPVLRMRGDYLAIVTLGFGEIARILVKSDWLQPYFGGPLGILKIPQVEVTGFTLVDSENFLYLIVGFLAITIYSSLALQKSRMGRAWMAMREDEDVAEALGVNILTAKLWAFIIGAIFAAIAGSLFAHKLGSVFPGTFKIEISIIVLVLIIVGGMASIPGVMVGAIVLIGVPEVLREFGEYRLMLYGALLIFMMMKRPEGLIPSRRRARELHHEEAEQDAWMEMFGEEETTGAGE